MGRGGGCRGWREVVGEIIVVFYGLQGGGFAKETEVVNWNWEREESLYC